MMEVNLEQDINAIKNNLSAFGMKLEMVYAALVGNEIAKDGGIVADIMHQREQIKELAERVQKVEERESKRQVYVRIIYACVAMIVTLVGTYIFNHLFK